MSIVGLLQCDLVFVAFDRHTYEGESSILLAGIEVAFARFKVAEVCIDVTLLVGNVVDPFITIRFAVVEGVQVESVGDHAANCRRIHTILTTVDG